MMAIESYSLLLRKEAEGATYNTLTQWGLACVDFPFAASVEAKDLTAQDWYDEDGEDVFVPDKITVKAYNAEVKFVYDGKASEVYSQIVSFTHYLTGEDGYNPSLSVYCPYMGIGRQGCYAQSVSNFEYWKESGGDVVVQFTVKFRITDPLTDIEL